MKKKQALIIALAVIVLVAILIVSQYYPPVDESESTGTIGKVDKYRNSKTTQEDIILRNEFLKDTTALKIAIIALESYQEFLAGLNDDFNEWENALSKTKYKSNEKLTQQLQELKLLAQFMNNNLSTVSETQKLLYKYYTKDTLNMSIDIQNNLINFSTFLANLEEKGKVVDSLFVNLTGIIENKKLSLLADTKEKTNSIIEVREKMLGSIAAWGLAMGNEAKMNLALNSNVINSILLNRQLNNKLGPIDIESTVESKEKLGVITNFDHLAVLNKEKLGTILNKEKLGTILNKEKFGPEYVVEAKDKLGTILSKEKLGYANSDKLNYVFSKSSLGLKAADVQKNRDDLGPIVYTASVAAAMNNKKLGTILNKEGLGIIASKNNYVFSKQGIGVIGNQKSLFNTTLGPIGFFAKSMQSFSDLRNKEKVGIF